MSPTARIGLIGFGYIGSYVYEQVRTHPEWGIEIAFVANRSALPSLAPSVPGFTNISAACTTKPDLVVEVAHPSISVKYGEEILQHSSYMPLSLSALADAALEARLRAAAHVNKTCLYIPHGAATSLDVLCECHDMWETVTVTMKKNPGNLDFAAAPQFKPDEISAPTLLYDGPTRGICSQFPRNVNSHAAVALAGIGFDRTRSILIADPTLDVSILEIEAQGKGLEMKLSRSNPLKGVSGVFTLRSILGSIQRVAATGLHSQVS